VALSAWLKEKGRVRLGAVCVSAFRTRGGRVLDGRRATAHWKFGASGGAIPGVRVEHDPLWVKDGNIYTSAGVQRASASRSRGLRKIARPVSPTEAARELCCFCDGRRTAQVSVSLRFTGSG